MNQRTGSPRSYRIAVPTKDSADWIPVILQAYRALGVEPVFLYDSRSSDDTLAVLETMQAEIIALEPRLDRVESMLSATRDALEAEWIVRFDDDELPSAALIAWLDNSLHRIEDPSIAFSRRDVRFVGERLCFSRLEDYYFHPGDMTYLDPQWRAFRPGDVDFTDAIHTPGFHISRFATAPSRAFFVHFDWILRPFEQRLAKLRRYERQSPGGGWPFARFYLPELHHHDDLRWTPFETAEFDSLARRLLNGATSS